MVMNPYSFLLILLVAVKYSSSFNVWSDWTAWSECTPKCQIGTQTRTRSCVSHPCAGDGTETSSCNSLCGCQLSLCNNGGTCIQNLTDPDVYDCACAAGYFGKNSQNCDNEKETGTSANPIIVNTGIDFFTLSTPFYPDTYPTLLAVSWTIQTSYTKLINLAFDYFNVNAPNSTSCVPDYNANVRQLLDQNGVTTTLTDAEVQIVCPCIYDMLIVNDGNITNITDASKVYCNAKPPPTSLNSSSDILTLKFVTDQTTYTGSGGNTGRKKRQVTSNNPGMLLNVTAVSDQCLPDPCQNGGNCTDGVDAFNCSCPVPYTGVTCEIFDYCYDNNNCSNGATCVSLMDTYNCTCTPGYIATHCDIIDYCYKNQNCSNGATCVTLTSGYNCSCSPGYSGVTCEIFDYCYDNNNCSNGATCVSVMNTYNCTCTPGYIATHCDIIDYCYNNQNCSNGATCVTLTSGYNCSCSPGYSGKTCDIYDYCFNNQNCSNGATCTSGDKGYNCTCVPGYMGTYCDVIDNCYSNQNCSHGGTCVNTETGYNCSCVTGYVGTHCETELLCVTNNISCYNGGTCVDSQDSWNCVCLQPWGGTNCTVFDYCYNNTNCSNGSTCQSLDTGYNCTCQSGYTGDHCETELLCTTKNIQCNNVGTCHDSPGNWTCLCAQPWNGEMCEIFDYCYNNTNCTNGATCVSGQTGYNCTCTPDYTGTHCETELVCATQNIVCGNGGTCMDVVPLNYTCVCPETWIGTNCTTSCNYTVDLTQTTSSKIITSPNHPNQYPDFTTCIWRVITDSTRTIEVTFSGSIDISTSDKTNCVNKYKSQVSGLSQKYGLKTYSDTDVIRMCPCIYDQLFIYYGTSMNVLDENGIYCNGRTPQRVISTTYSSITILLRTDSGKTGVTSSADTGYNLSVKATGDACDPNPCENGGTCTDLVQFGQFNCTCTEAYTGETCTTDVNECSDSNLNICDNDVNQLAVCDNEYGSYSCVCHPYESRGISWNGTTCTTGKNLDNLCSVSNGLCVDKCTPFVLSTNISSVLNYRCGCGEGYQLATDGRSCVDIDECQTNCTSTQIPKSVCVNTVGSYSCTCKEGYVLNMNTSTCDNIDECATRNGGCAFNCTDTDGSYLCSCDKAGFYLLENKQTCWDVDECSSNNGGCEQICTNSFGSYQCGCLSGYILNSNNKNCDDIDECKTFNGRCAQVCHNFNGTYNCSCNTGYSLAIDGQSCLNTLKPCADPNPCEYQCIADQRTYTCVCPVGYSLLNATNCTDIDECLNNNGGCSHNCTNTQGSYTCDCSSGYYLLSDDRSCQDINECASLNNCTYQCLNTIGSYVCTCPNGFIFNASSQQCEDINECLTNNGRCQQKCNNTVGSFNCECLSGYTLWPDKRTCQDINECQQNSTISICQNECVNDFGSYYCRCRDRYTLVNKVKCQGPVIIRIMLKLNITYTQSMSDPTSASFVKLSTQLEATIMALMNNLEYGVSVPKQESVAVVYFSPGSVTATVYINYENNLDNVTMSVITYTIAQAIRQQGNILEVGGQNVQVLDIPLMEYIGYDGQTVQWNITSICHLYNNLDLCKNHGTCMEKNNVPECQCQSGYSGIYCDSTFDYLILIITIPIIIAFIPIIAGICFVICIQEKLCASNKKQQIKRYTSGAEVVYEQTQLIYNKRIHRAQIYHRPLYDFGHYHTNDYDGHSYAHSYRL